MMRSVVAVVFSVLASGLDASSDVTPNNVQAELDLNKLELIAGGAVIGFVSDNSMDVMTCGLSLLSVVGDLKQALTDIEQAIKTKNITIVADALNEVAEVINSAPGAKAACKIPVDDVKSIVKVIKQYKGFLVMVEHMAHDLLFDGERIFSELAAAEHNYKSGDFLSAGQQLGMALRRLLVAEAAPGNSTTRPPTPLTLSAIEAIVAGAAMGFVADTPDLMNCGVAILPVIGDLKPAILDIVEGLMEKNWTKIADSLESFADAIRDAATAKADCHWAIVDVKAIRAEVKKYKGTFGLKLVAHMMHDLLVDGENIFSELALAEHSYKTSDLLETGRQLGMAFRRTLVAEVAPPKHNATAAISILV